MNGCRFWMRPAFVTLRPCGRPLFCSSAWPCCTRNEPSCGRQVGLVLVALMAFLGTSDYLGEGELTHFLGTWRIASRFPIAATRTIDRIGGKR